MNCHQAENPYLFSESGDMSGVVGVEEPGLKKVSTPSDMSWSSSTRSARPMGRVGARVFTLRGRALPKCWSWPQLLGSSDTLSRDSAVTQHNTKFNTAPLLRVGFF